MVPCRYHPDTPAVGICVRCRTVICDACCTRLQGINHCHECMKELARGKGRARGAGSVLAALALLALGSALFFGLLLLAQGRLAP